MNQPFYDPSIFYVSNEREARKIILMQEAGMSTQERWEKETPAVLNLMQEAAPEAQTWLDYGTGIGRLAKPLCEQGKEVIGVDLSPDMRRLAKSYVNSPHFTTLSPKELALWVIQHGPADAAIVAWTLQHIPNLEEVCSYISFAVKEGGTLCLLNRRNRAIPIMGGSWLEDGKDVAKAVAERGFKILSAYDLGLPIFESGSIWSTWTRITQ